MHKNEAEEPRSKEGTLKQDQGSSLSVKAPVWVRRDRLGCLSALAAVHGFYPEKFAIKSKTAGLEAGHMSFCLFGFFPTLGTIQLSSSLGDEVILAFSLV